mmetsp:Transcript_80126/g.120419  ORF Transcript_80126/g.120419 Transcript_80126/m.120419 type:complete len:229 (-) Transcript_80126:316-1002(-)
MAWRKTRARGMPSGYFSSVAAPACTKNPNSRRSQMQGSTSVTRISLRLTPSWAILETHGIMTPSSSFKCCSLASMNWRYSVISCPSRRRGSAQAILSCSSRGCSLLCATSNPAWEALLSNLSLITAKNPRHPFVPSSVRACNSCHLSITATRSRNTCGSGATRMSFIMPLITSWPLRMMANAMSFAFSVALGAGSAFAHSGTPGASMPISSLMALKREGERPAFTYGR